MSTAVNIYAVQFAAVRGDTPAAPYIGLWDRREREGSLFLGYTRPINAMGPYTLGPYMDGDVPIIPAGSMQLDIKNQELTPITMLYALRETINNAGQLYAGLHEDFPGSIGQHEWDAALFDRAKLVGIGEYAWTITLTQFPLGPPTLVRAVPASPPNHQTRLVITWEAPFDLGGEAITGYKIEVSTDNMTWTDLVADTNNTNVTYTHQGLSAGTTRYYRVSAITANRTGPVSLVGSGTTES